MFFTDTGELGVLTDISAGSFYIVTRQRNAWHGAESRQYKGPASLTSTFHEAATVAERWRRQGSQFTIQQVPGLTITSDRAVYGLVEFHTNDSFSGWLGGMGTSIRPGTPVSETLESLFGLRSYVRGWRPHPGGDSFVWKALEVPANTEPIDETTSFSAWSSEFLGSQYLIHWVKHEGRHRPGGTLRVCRLFGENYAREQGAPTADSFET